MVDDDRALKAYEQALHRDDRSVEALRDLLKDHPEAVAEDDDEIYAFWNLQLTGFLPG